MTDTKIKQPKMENELKTWSKEQPTIYRKWFVVFRPDRTFPALGYWNKGYTWVEHGRTPTDQTPVPADARWSYVPQPANWIP